MDIAIRTVTLAASVALSVESSACADVDWHVFWPYPLLSGPSPKTGDYVLPTGVMVCPAGLLKKVFEASEA